jgi:serine/threonine-protein kinase
MLCPSCRSLVDEAARFCPACGAPQTGSSTPEAGDATRSLAPVATQAATIPSTPARRHSGGWLTSSGSISHGHFAPGAIVSDRYRIIGLLGRGGMGEVYRADDLRLGQPVALKFLPPDLTDDVVRLAQLHNEVRTARQVSHPNICRVHDIGEANNQIYLSMEYVDGEDLASSLRRIGRFPEDKASAIARQLCAGLAAAHERGILHRDLKPANVMLDGAGNVRVMDFGLAAVGPVADVRAGTPAYMAPEQLLGREVSQRSDIFALGLILYELFTGRRAFTASSVGELVAQHEARAAAAPSSIVTSLDPAIDRAIQRCLEPEPGRRPSSALAVAASLPGGDPLAAALAAGETPSPEMVAAAGEGTRLRARIAVPVFIAILAGLSLAFALSIGSSPLQRMRPELGPEVLAQKAREAIAAMGYPGRPADAAFSYEWASSLIDHVSDSTVLRWDDVLTNGPMPLRFRYRQSQEAMTGDSFHHDMLTMGIVDAEDPPPIQSGMIQAWLDARGRLVYFEAIPPQRLEPAAGESASVDWDPVMRLAGVDPSSLAPTEPLWTSLATSDLRAAWTGTWPGSTLPLRVEAAAFRGKPVMFMMLGPWDQPWREPSPSLDRQTVFLIVVFLIFIAMLVGAGLLARRNLRNGRGDRRSAARLATFMVLLLLALWGAQAHIVMTPGLLGSFAITVCTAIFYGVVVWTIYLALEPYVRRHWPLTLVSWTTLLTSGPRDAIVGRDVLLGLAVGVTLAVMIKTQMWLTGDVEGFTGRTELLDGLRGTVSLVLQHTAYAIRSALFFFFALFALRVVLRSERLAAVAFAVLFSLLNSLGSNTPLQDFVPSVLFFGLLAFSVLNWGLLSLTLAFAIGDIILNAPVTGDLSAWFAGKMLLNFGLVAGLATWALVTSMTTHAGGARS